MFKLALCILTFAATLTACEQIQEKSKLCEFFGIDEKLCSLPLDVQNIIAQKLFHKFRDLFADYVVKEPLVQLRAHKRHITGLIFIDNGKTLISSSIDGHVIFWSIPSFEKIKELHIDTPHNGEVRDKNGIFMRIVCPSILAANEDESLLAVSTKKNADLRDLATTITLIDLKNLERGKTFSTELCIGYLWFVSGKRLLIAPAPFTRQRWFEMIEYESGNITSVSIPEVPYNPSIYAAALSSDNRTLLIMDTNFIAMYALNEHCVELIKTIPLGHTIGRGGDHLMFIGDNILAYIAASSVIAVKKNNKLIHESVFPEKNEYFIYLEEGALKDFVLSRYMERYQAGINRTYQPKPYFTASHYNERSKQLFVLVSDGSALLFDVENKRKIATYRDLLSQQFNNNECHRRCILHPFFALAIISQDTRWGENGRQAIADQEHLIPLSIWMTLPIDYLFQNKACSIKEALFFLMLHLLKKEATAAGLKRLQCISFPKDLGTECRNIFNRFTSAQQSIIRSVLFSNLHAT